MSSDYRNEIKKMDQTIYNHLIEALETGCWPDGRKITEAQRINAMRAVITWGEIHLPQQARVGYVDKGGRKGRESDESVPVRWEDT